MIVSTTIFLVVICHGLADQSDTFDIQCSPDPNTKTLIEDIKENVDATADNMDEVKEKVSSVESRMVSVEGRMVSVEGKLDHLKQMLEQLIANTQTIVSPVLSPATTRKPTLTIPTTASTTTTSSPVPQFLFLGPGSGSSGRSELLSLPSLSPANCSPPPVHPKSGIHASVSTSTPDGALICGGHHSSGHQEDCHLLGKGGVWLGAPPMQKMQTKRSYSAAIQFGLGWWVTGGYNGARLASTELYYNHAWHDHIDLPQALSGHCLVKINSSHALLTGGYTNTGSYSAATYLFSENTGWVQQEDMRTARVYHGCSLYSDDLVFVAGGTGGGDKVEYFSLSTLSWSPGPPLPVSTQGGVMMSVNQDTVFIGGNTNKKLFQLEKTGHSFDWWQWREVGEMTSSRTYFSAIILDMFDCDDFSG